MYKRGDKVVFHCPKQTTWDGKLIAPEQDICGVIEIVDPFGTFEQNEWPSYDIYDNDKNVLYKHVIEPEVIKYIGKADDAKRMKW